MYLVSYEYFLIFLFICLFPWFSAYIIVAFASYGTCFGTIFGDHISNCLPIILNL